MKSQSGKYELVNLSIDNAHSWGQVRISDCPEETKRIIVALSMNGAKFVDLSYDNPPGFMGQLGETGIRTDINESGDYSIMLAGLNENLEKTLDIIDKNEDYSFGRYEEGVEFSTNFMWATFTFEYDGFGPEFLLPTLELFKAKDYCRGFLPGYTRSPMVMKGYGYPPKDSLDGFMKLLVANIGDRTYLHASIDHFELFGEPRLVKEIAGMAERRLNYIKDVNILGQS